MKKLLLAGVLTLMWATGHAADLEDFVDRCKVFDNDCIAEGRAAYCEHEFARETPQQRADFNRCLKWAQEPKRVAKKGITKQLPRSAAGDYCRKYLTPTWIRVLYKRGLCDGTSYRDSASLTRTHYENGRDVKCKFLAVKQLGKRLYRVQAGCVDSHAAPVKFSSTFELEILPNRNLLLAYPLPAYPPKQMESDDD
jgi:hypothetical protein